MSPARLANLIATSLSTAVVFVLTPMAFGDGCLTCRHKCPPPYVHCQEGPPCLRFKCGCPKPVCDPCTLEHYGYYQTCWRPWSFPPDASHCPQPQPVIELQGAIATPPVEEAPSLPSVHLIPNSTMKPQ